MKLSPIVFHSLVTLSAATPIALDTKHHVTYKGTSAHGVESFLGISFGQDTGGAKRFTRPVKSPIEQGSTIDATKPGPDCPQQRVPIPGFPLFSNVSHISEDCLNLRVDRAADTKASDSLPVMVYIYGGGYSLGQAYDQTYNPTGLILGASAKKTPIVYVAMNYRMNLFGFASSDALFQEGNTNAGLLDQRLALQWVQDNIAYFGGNPDRVTVFGESAGAVSVGLQITGYGGKGKPLFHRAILESGAANLANSASNFSAESTMTIAKRLNCHGSSKNILQCLRAVPLSKLLPVTLKFEKSVNKFTFDAFIPTVDGDFIPDAPSKLVRSGRFYKDITTLIGWNRNDDSLFTSTTLSTKKQVVEYLGQSYPGLTKDTIEHLLSLYPVSNFHNHFNTSRQYYRTIRLERDFRFSCPSINLAFAMQKYSRSTNSYIYQLDQTPLAALWKQSGNHEFSVSHFSDIFYVFNEVAGLPYPLKESDYTIASQMSGSWAQFAWSGIPSNDKANAANETLPDWPVAFEDEKGSALKRTVFAIGGNHPGPVRLGPNTMQPGLEHLVSRCAYMSTPRFYEQLMT